MEVFSHTNDQTMYYKDHRRNMDILILFRMKFCIFPDDCCQLSSQVMATPMQTPPIKSALASPQLAQQILPIQVNQLI